MWSTSSAEVIIPAFSTRGTATPARARSAAAAPMCGQAALGRALASEHASVILADPAAIDRVAAGSGHDVVVADLAPAVVGAAQLGLLGDRIGTGAGAA